MRTARFAVFAAFALSLAFVSQASAQVMAPKQNEPRIIWKEEAFNFGTIVQGKPVSHGFEFTNPNNQPVLIDKVQSSCACVTAKIPTSPVAVGGKGEVTLTYNAAAKGDFIKTVTVITVSSSKTTVLTVKGKVK